jgi:uncharacterized membrane protein
MLLLSLVGLFKAKRNAGDFQGFVGGPFGTSFLVKNVAWNQCRCVAFMLLLSLVGLFKAKTNAGDFRGFVGGPFGTSF